MKKKDDSGGTDELVDLVVVGGGIHGVLVFLEASRRGIRTLLLEKADFGGQSSGNSLRILHRGVRYLQTLDLGRVRSSVLASSWFLNHFPEFVAPLECLMPLYGKGVRRPLLFHLAFGLHRASATLSGKRGSTLIRPKPGRVVGGPSTERLAPLVQPTGLKGGAVWEDGIILNPPRILMECLRWGTALGGRAHNYSEVRALQATPEGEWAVQVKDLVGERHITYRAKEVAVCGGPFPLSIEGVSTPAVRADPSDAVAINLAVDEPLGSDRAVAIEIDDESRGTLFLVPFGNRTLVGTYHLGPSGRSEGKTTTQAAEELLDHIRAAVPAWPGSRAQIIRVFSGLIPADLKGDQIICYRSLGLPGQALGVRGGKYTTAPLTAARVVAKLFGKRLPSLGQRLVPTLRPVLSAEEFLQLHRSDPDAAMAWALRIVDEERVIFPEDFTVRRMDWGLDGGTEEEARGIIRRVLPE